MLKEIAYKTTGKSSTKLLDICAKKLRITSVI